MQCGDDGGTPREQQPCEQNLLKAGVFAKVHLLLDQRVVRKVAPGDRALDQKPVRREATIYEALGRHPRIVECLSFGNMDFVDLRYYANGPLDAYLRRRRHKGGGGGGDDGDGAMNPMIGIPLGQRRIWFRQIMEAVDFIHSRGVIHSDLALRQFFVDDDLNVRLGDFNASQYLDQAALGFERATHCLPRNYREPSTAQSDLFALGSTLYELSAGWPPYRELYPFFEFEKKTDDAGMRSNEEYDDAIVVLPLKARRDRRHRADASVETLFAQRVFPPVSGLLGGDVIIRCWKGKFSSARAAISFFDRSERK